MSAYNEGCHHEWVLTGEDDDFRYLRCACGAMQTVEQTTCRHDWYVVRRNRSADFTLYECTMCGMMKRNDEEPIRP